MSKIIRYFIGTFFNEEARKKAALSILTAVGVILFLILLPLFLLVCIINLGFASAEYSSINNDIFFDFGQKNSEDLSRWAENAALKQWGYTEGWCGQLDDLNRFTDNLGLIQGYFFYNPNSKDFDLEYDFEQTVINFFFLNSEDYSLNMADMPDQRGVVIMKFGSSALGIYVGNGEVIYADKTQGKVVRETINESWNAWCRLEDLNYL